MYNTLGANKNLLYIIVFYIISCSKVSTPQDIKHITGYWEIEKVQFPDGSIKEYGFNPIIDFFEIKDTIGIRKKVQPRINGNYIISKDNELFTIFIKDNNIALHYKTALASWTETIISSEENKMIIKNEVGNMYFYKRHQKIKL